MEKVENKEITMEEVIKNHPSICYTCRYARKVAHKDNTIEGWVACNKPIYDELYHVKSCKDLDDFLNKMDIEAKELGEGWANLQNPPTLKDTSGMITNYQLLTNEVTHCKGFWEK